MFFFVLFFFFLEMAVSCYMALNVLFYVHIMHMHVYSMVAAGAVMLFRS